MSTTFIPQRFANVHQFFNAADIRMSPAKKHYWRLTEVRPGEFRGCPGSRGLLMATNGILAFTLNEVGRSFLGHLENFISDEVEVEENADTNKKTASRKTALRKNVVLDELRELVE